MNTLLWDTDTLLGFEESRRDELGTISDCSLLETPIMLLSITRCISELIYGKVVQEGDHIGHIDLSDWWNVSIT